MHFNDILLDIRTSATRGRQAQCRNNLAEVWVSTPRGLVEGLVRVGHTCTVMDD